MVPNLHGCHEVCDLFCLVFLDDLTISLLASSSSCSLSLLDFLHVLAFGNELLGKVISWVVFVNDEGVVQKFPDTFQRENEYKQPIFYLLSVSLRTCQQSSDISLACIEQLQEIVAEFDSTNRFDDEWCIQQLHAENLL